MRYTKKLSMWPVGLSGGRTYETPILKDGKVGAFKESNQILHKFFSVFRFYIYSRQQTLWFWFDRLVYSILKIVLNIIISFSTTSKISDQTTTEINRR